MSTIGSSRRSPSPTYPLTNPRLVNLITNGASGASATYKISGDAYVQLEVYGSATAGTATFFTIGRSGEERAITGVKQADNTSSATGVKGDVLKFDVTFAEQLVVRLSGVTGGTLSVNGKAV